MGYAERFLQPNERIEHISRLHWIIFMPGLSMLAVGMIGFALVPADLAIKAPGYLLTLVCLPGLLKLLHEWFTQHTTEIAVTNHRIIYKRGFFRRHTVEMNMSKVESVNVDQTFTGRALGYGTITIHGTGIDTEPLRGIDTPMELRNAIKAD
jgi:uncharacterized membrane protein YdbT with pleckstrin-like domain